MNAMGWKQHQQVVGEINWVVTKLRVGYSHDSGAAALERPQGGAESLGAHQGELRVQGAEARRDVQDRCAAERNQEVWPRGGVGQLFGNVMTDGAAP
eukprot:1695660-Pyramimonas_sp.AAC.1